MLRSMWFAVLPSGTMDESEDRRPIAEFSLPSRLVYLMCTSHIPVIVLGSRDTAAAHFVEQFGIGVVANYDRDSFLNAVHHISRPDVNLAMRRRGLAAVGRFVDTGVGEWIWNRWPKGSRSIGASRICCLNRRSLAAFQSSPATVGEQSILRKRALDALIKPPSPETSD